MWLGAKDMLRLVVVEKLRAGKIKEEPIKTESEIKK